MTEDTSLSSRLSQHELDSWTALFYCSNTSHNFKQKLQAKTVNTTQICKTNILNIERKLKYQVSNGTVQPGLKWEPLLEILLSLKTVESYKLLSFIFSKITTESGNNNVKNDFIFRLIQSCQSELEQEGNEKKFYAVTCLYYFLKSVSAASSTSSNTIFSSNLKFDQLLNILRNELVVSHTSSTVNSQIKRYTLILFKTVNILLPFFKNNNNQNITVINSTFQSIISICLSVLCDDQLEMERLVHSTAELCFNNEILGMFSDDFMSDAMAVNSDNGNGFDVKIHSCCLFLLANTICLPGIKVADIWWQLCRIDFIKFLNNSDTCTGTSLLLVRMIESSKKFLATASYSNDMKTSSFLLTSKKLFDFIYQLHSNLIFNILNDFEKKEQGIVECTLKVFEALLKNCLYDQYSKNEDLENILMQIIEILWRISSSASVENVKEIGIYSLATTIQKFTTKKSIEKLKTLLTNNSKNILETVIANGKEEKLSKAWSFLLQTACKTFKQEITQIIQKSTIFEIFNDNDRSTRNRNNIKSFEFLWEFLTVYCQFVQEDWWSFEFFTVASNQLSLCQTCHFEVKANIIEVIAQINEKSYNSLSPQLKLTVLSFLFSSNSDSDVIKPQISGCNLLAKLITFQTLFTDSLFVVDCMDYIKNFQSNSSQLLRLKSSLVLVNLCESLFIKLSNFDDCTDGMKKDEIFSQPNLLSDIFTSANQFSFDVDKIRSNGLRSLGLLFSVLDCSAAKQETLKDGNVMALSLQSLPNNSLLIFTKCFCRNLSSGPFKTRWNAGFSLSFTFQHNQSIINALHSQKLLNQIISCLSLEFSTSKNFKVRIQSLAALIQVPRLFWPREMYYKIFNECQSLMEDVSSVEGLIENEQILVCDDSNVNINVNYSNNLKLKCAEFLTKMLSQSIPSDFKGLLKKYCREEKIFTDDTLI